jgi:serine/threonine-protein kinase RsbW
MRKSSSSSPNGRGGRGRAHPTAGARDSADRGGGMTKVTIATDFVASRELQKRILDEVVANGFHDNALFAIKLSLEEAMHNAVKHGNKQKEDKNIHVEYSITPKRAEIVIEDEGTGFEPMDVPDPTDDENLIKCSGRGILLIKAYMNEVEYSRGGRRLRMMKKNEDHALAHKGKKK